MVAPPVYAPDPSLHSDPAVLARCPYCNPKPAPKVGDMLAPGRIVAVSDAWTLFTTPIDFAQSRQLNEQWSAAQQYARIQLSRERARAAAMPD